MGLFDIFSRKPKQDAVNEAQPVAQAPPGPAPPAPDPSLSPWQKRLWEAEHGPGFAWRDDNEPARALARALLGQARSAFGGGPVVNGEPTPYVSTGSVLIDRFGDGRLRAEDRNVELRGTWDGVPVRIAISLSAKRIWTVEVRCEERARFFTVLRDLERVPKKPDSKDPWASSQVQCVFLGKGIFIDDSDPETARDWMIPAWASLPAGAQELVVREMEQLDLRVLHLSNSDQELFALGAKTLAELADPIAYMQSCAAFLAGFAKALAAAPKTTVGASASHAAASPIMCKYCSSKFLIAVGKNTCPNCGAPAE